MTVAAVRADAGAPHADAERVDAAARAAATAVRAVADAFGCDVPADVRYRDGNADFDAMVDRAVADAFPDVADDAGRLRAARAVAWRAAELLACDPMLAELAELTADARTMTARMSAQSQRRAQLVAALRSRGFSLGQIAERVGVTRAAVAQMERHGRPADQSGRGER